MTSEDLKPCPFCGGKAKNCQRKGYDCPDGFWTKCTTKGCAAEESEFVSKDKAYAAWNRRADLSDKPPQSDQPSDESRALEKEKRDREQTIIDRDCYHEWADMLAEGISNYFGHGIGEHSNLNNPWKEACEMIEVAIVQKENEAARAQKPEPEAVDIDKLLHNTVVYVAEKYPDMKPKYVRAAIDYLSSHGLLRVKEIK